MRETGLYNLFKHYKKYWLTILVLGLVGFIIGLIYNSFVQVPKYKSNATLIIIKNDESTNSKNSTLINNYIRLFKSRKVLEPTINDLKLNQSYESLAGSIEATNDTDTEVVKFSVISDNAKTSQQTLDHAITIFKNEAKSLYKKDNIQIVDKASLENNPYNVNALMQLLIATGIGLLIPIVIIFFIYDIDFNNKKRQEQLIALDGNSDKEDSTKNTPLNDTVDTPAPTPEDNTKPATATRISNTPESTTSRLTSHQTQTTSPIVNTARSLNIPNRRG